MAKGSATWKRVKFGEVVRLRERPCATPQTAGVERVRRRSSTSTRRPPRSADGATSATDIDQFTTRSSRASPLREAARLPAQARRRGLRRHLLGDTRWSSCRSPTSRLPELLAVPLPDRRRSSSTQSASRWARCRRRSTGQSLAEYEFALPPLEEQRRIARCSCSGATTDAASTIARWLQSLEASCELARERTLPDTVSVLGLAAHAVAVGDHCERHRASRRSCSSRPASPIRSVRSTRHRLGAMTSHRPGRCRVREVAD